MPTFDLQRKDVEGIVLPEGIGTPDAPKLEGSVFESAFRQEFAPASLMAYQEHKPGRLTPVELDDLEKGKFDYQEHIPQGFEQYEEEYAKYGVSKRHTDWITDNIRREQFDRQIISEGGMGGFAATTFAAMASPEQWPTYFIPGALILKEGVRMGSRAAVITTEAAIAVTGAAVGETVLHGSQIVRTKEESAFAIAGSAIFAGLITGGVMTYKGVSRSAQEFAADIDADIRIMDGDVRVDEIDPRNMGAAEAKADIVETHRKLVETAENNLNKAVEGGDPNLIAGAKARFDELSAIKPEKLTELKHPKLAKALGFISPAIRLAGSRVSSARELAATLIDDPMLRVRNKYGDTLAPSIESNMAVFEQSMGHKVVDAVSTSFTLYKKAMKEMGEKALPREEFAREIGRAMRNNDEGVNDFITKAAKMLRSEVADPIQMRLDAQDMLDRRVVDYGVLTKDDLIEAGIETPDMYFKEDGTPKANLKSIDADARDWLVRQGKLQTEIRTPTGDASYLHRLWDFTAIREQPDLFEARIAEYFHGKARETIHTKTVGKVEARIEKLETELTALDAKVAASKKKPKVTERTYEARQAELAELKAKRKALTEAGDVEGVKALKTPKRTDAQRAYDKRQELQYRRDVETPAARREYDAQIVVAKRQADNMATDVRLKIEGEEYNPAMGADRTVYDVGPLKARTLAVPTEIVSDFVENDVEKVMQRYVRGVNTQLHFKETFDPASPSSVKVGKDPQKAGVTAFEEKMESVHVEYEAKAKEAAAAGNAKEAAKIRKEWTAVKRDMGAMQEVLFNKYKLPDNPSGFWHQARQRLKEFNMMTMLGMMTISAIPDVGNYIARRGMKSFSRDMVRMATNMKALRLSAQMNRRMGLSSDLMNSSRVEKMYAMDDQMAPISKTTTGGKILRGWKNTQNTFTQATGMPLWNNIWKNMAATSYIDDIAIDAMKLRDGKLSQKSIEGYARGGLGIDELTKISKQLNKDRDMIDGVWVPDIDEWADQNIAGVFKAAVRKEVDMTIVTPGKGDLPLNSRGETGKLIFQFKSFSISANNRILLASLDDMSADKVAGMMAMTMLGYTSYAARQTLKGKEVETDYDTFVREGLDRSGQLAILGELNAMASKATAGEADMYRLLGADKATLTRYASRNMLSTAMGVSAGRVQDLGQLTSAVASGDFKETDIRAMRRATIMNNLWFTHRGFTEIEKSLGGSK